MIYQVWKNEKRIGIQSDVTLQLLHVTMAPHSCKDRRALGGVGLKLIYFILVFWTPSSMKATPGSSLKTLLHVLPVRKGRRWKIGTAERVSLQCIMRNAYTPQSQRLQVKTYFIYSGNTLDSNFGTNLPHTAFSPRLLALLLSPSPGYELYASDANINRRDTLQQEILALAY